MALKVEAEVELKSPPEKLYNMFKKQSYNMPTASSKYLQAVEVHEGDWETHGSIKLWNYTVEGKTETLKERVELDDENMKVTVVGLEGDVLKIYKSYKAIFHYTPKGAGTLAKLAVEYEKLSDDVRDPINSYLDLVVNVTKDMDAHLVKA